MSLQDAIESIERNRKLLDAIHRSPLIAFAEQMQRIELPKVNFDDAYRDAVRSVSAIGVGIESVNLQFNAISESLKSFSSLSEKIENVTSNLFGGILGFQSDLSRIAVQISSISDAYSGFQPKLQALALSPSLNATQHIARTANALDRWENAGRSVESLMISIAITESQSVAQDSDIIDYPDTFSFEDFEEDSDFFDPGTVATQNIFEVQRTELIYIARKHPDMLEDHSAIEGLPSMKLFSRSRNVCKLITQINEQCRLAGRDHIFKLTNRFAESLVSLPNVAAVNQRVFGEFVDCLYFIIYEGAGKDNLRFMDLFDDDSSAEPVWELKNIRNFFVRHDVDHGKERAVRKKEKRLSEIFNGLINSDLPRSRSDFSNAQYEFLGRIESFLFAISDKLVEQASLIGESETNNE